jgi:multidrug efflux pump subunit AcrB
LSANKHGFFNHVVSTFVRGNLPLLIMMASIVAGFLALRVTPREEEPQIVVPLADIMVSYPGGSAEDVEKLVSSRLERLLYQIDGVEYVYSMSRPEQAIATVRFYVGEDREDSLLKLHNKLQQNIDLVTPGIAGWIVKPLEIDDVPIVNATLYSERYDSIQLYRVAEELVAKLQRIPNTGPIRIHGGKRQIVEVILKPERLAAYQLAPQDIAGAIQVSSAQLISGSVESGNAQVLIEGSGFLRSIGDLQHLVVAMEEDRPVYLRDVADIQEGPLDADNYTRFGFGPASEQFQSGQTGGYQAVTISVCKKPGSNAVWVAREVQDRLAELREKVIPDEVGVAITRDYGATANDKVNELVSSLVLAVITVVGLLAFTLHLRAGLIVAIAVPITYSLTLLFNYLMGYTINRVTLFALILALGLLVDDPIAGVENIERHLREKRGQPRIPTIVGAMREIMSPILLSTIAIILAFTPMFFITGMMGPYMRPMAINVPLAVLMSTVVALTVTPWLTRVFLKTAEENVLPGAEVATGQDPATQKRLYRVYSGIVAPFIDSKRKSIVLLIVVGCLFVLSVALALTRFVPLKMLPFDNKNEFQVVVDMPETAPLEETNRVIQEVEDFLRGIPEVVSFVSYAGTGSPMDFNGLVRHYYLRQGSNVGDIRVQLVPKEERKAASHALILRIRNDIAAIAKRTGASLKLVEVPPGPPVLSTLVAEIYGSVDSSYDDLVEAAGIVKARMLEEPGVVDVDDSIEVPQKKWRFEVDREKAARNGISVQQVTEALNLAVSGGFAGLIHLPEEQNEFAIYLRLGRLDRSMVSRLETLSVRGRGGDMVQIGELGRFVETESEITINHKNMDRVVYVTAEVAGRGPAYSVLALQSHFKQNPLPDGIRLDWSGEGEWKITLDVFRDLGIAFAIALMGIYVLLVYETTSFLLPVVIMLSIPLTMIGIMPGFGLLNSLFSQVVGGYDDAIFFTATAMIGMIALSGIVVRNAIVLIDFIATRVDEGIPLRAAILQSGAVRMRPILLTAGTTLLGTWPITFDPIFSGLAWSIIFGLLVSTLFTLLVIPVVYHLLYRDRVLEDHAHVES